MAKMRVSQHSGRSGSAKHNDRTFLSDKSEKERREMAPHISENASGDNRFWCWQEADNFEQAEMNFYRKYSASIEATNARYRAEGHAERCKTVEQVYRGKLTRPEEMILQIGDMNSNISPSDFIKCVNSYINRLNEWNQEHGNHMHLLNIAIHVDESSPHAHIRRVWDYTDKDGLIRLGQNKGLEQAGVSLPNPEKPSGRYNNRKMSFDAMAREMWQETCREHGFEIETEPRHNLKHKDKAEFIADKLNEQIKKEREKREYYKEESKEVQKKYMSQKVENHRLEKKISENVQIIEQQEQKIQQLKEKYAAMEKQPPLRKEIEVKKYIDVPVERIVEVKKEVEVERAVEINVDYKKSLETSLNAFRLQSEWLCSKGLSEEAYNDLADSMDFLRTNKTIYPKNKAKVKPLLPDTETALHK